MMATGHQEKGRMICKKTRRFWDDATLQDTQSAFHVSCFLITTYGNVLGFYTVSLKSDAELREVEAQIFGRDIRGKKTNDKMNKKLLPLKAHFFFFMAASGPILPYLTVYGKQMGISEVVMGSVTAAVPITFLLAKPIFGFIVDYFHNRRKLIFMSLIVSMSIFYLALYFVPPINIELEYFKKESNISRISFCSQLSEGDPSFFNESTRNIQCNITCTKGIESTRCRILGLNLSGDFCYENLEAETCNWTEIPSECHEKCVEHMANGSHLFQSLQFYGFIILMTLSMISFNVSNSISDAICFDVLGEDGQKSYGHQRVWGTIGFGITALLGGVGMDLWSGGEVKDYTLAFVLVVVCTFVDIIWCRRLKLPSMSLSESIVKDLSKVLKNKSISIFLVFATLVGILDGFIIYFMFWFLEDLALSSNQMKYIKILEGLTVAAETLGGEVIFFLLSGKILDKIGYGHTLSLCFFNYSLRLGLISIISNPWWILPVELVMQGPTYALCYTTIVAYANAISPPGTSATMQGIVAGMDDGFGYALGSLLGGFIYKAVEGRLAFQMFSLLSLVCCVAHMILYKRFLSKSYKRGPPQAYKLSKDILQNS